MKIKEKLTNIGTKIVRKKNELMLCAMTLPATASMTALAEGEGGGGSAGSIIGGALGGFILPIVAAGGAVFAIYGAIKLVMAYRDQNPDAQNAAVKDIIIGAALIAIMVLYGIIAPMVGLGGKN